MIVPERLLAMRYDGACVPGAGGARAGFGNCQSFAYALLRHFGRTIPDFRSSELWDDKIHTYAVSQWKPLDLILFNRTNNAFGAHVGVFLGEDEVIHLCIAVGQPAAWTLRQFAILPRYRTNIGAKRTRK